MSSAESVAAVRRRMGEVGGNAAVSVLVDAVVSGEVSQGDAGLGEIVVDAWLGAAFPERVISAREWVALFEMAALPRPSAPITVYRGCTHDRGGGMAWTTDIEVARSFARRCIRSGAAMAAVYSMVVAPAAVVALVDEVAYGGRLEAEVVVDPEGFGPIQRIEEITE